MTSPYNQDVNNPHEAARFDEGKDRMELVPVSMFKALAKVLAWALTNTGILTGRRGSPGCSLMRPA